MNRRQLKKRLRALEAENASLRERVECLEDELSDYLYDPYEDRDEDCWGVRLDPNDNSPSGVAKRLYLEGCAKPWDAFEDGVPALFMGSSKKRDLGVPAVFAIERAEPSACVDFLPDHLLPHPPPES